MSLVAYWVVFVPAALAAAGVAGFLFYIWWRYCPFIVRIFEETPVFAPLRVTPESGGEEIRFHNASGLELAGSYFPRRRGPRTGVLLFCPEYLGDRWSFAAYMDGLREVGFDVFTFDFRNHGDSEVDPTYEPLQWVSDREVADLEAAVAYLESRPDRDPAGLGLFGISRGGGTALCVAARNPAVWAVATDGAFPTRGTMLSYVIRWAEIPVKSKLMLRFMPHFVYVFAGWTGRVASEWRRGCKHPNLERAVARLSPRPWFMIHGERDVYISPEIALGLYGHASDPREAWIVPGAKHNRCRELDPQQYRERLVDFFCRNAPRKVDPTRQAQASALDDLAEPDLASSESSPAVTGPLPAISGELAAR